jgi:hypothetical protein
LGSRRRRVIFCSSFCLITSLWELISTLESSGSPVQSWSGTIESQVTLPSWIGWTVIDDIWLELRHALRSRLRPHSKD